MRVFVLSISLAFIVGTGFGQQTIDTVAGGAIRSGVPAKDVAVGLPSAAFNYAADIGLARDHAGNLAFADVNGTVIRRIRTDGIVETIAGTGQSGFSGDGGPATQAQMNAGPMVYDAHDNLYFYGNSRIRKISSSGMVTTVAGTGVYGLLNTDALHAQIQRVTSFAFDGSGNLYFSEYEGFVRRLTKAGAVEAVAGIGSLDINHPLPPEGDEGPALQAAFLGIPRSIAFDPAGNLFVAIDRQVLTPANLIRRITPDGIIHQFAGYGSVNASMRGDGGPAMNAGFTSLGEVAFDGNGHLIVSDSWIWSIDLSSGFITHLAGASSVNSQTTSNDGTALNVTLGGGGGLVAGSNGGIVFRGSGRIRRLTSDAQIETIAGGNRQPAPDGILAKEAWLGPDALALDKLGTVFFSEPSGCRIRKVDTDGRIITVAGTGTCGSSFPRGPALTANLLSVRSMAINSQGRLYFVDSAGLSYFDPSGTIIGVPNTQAAPSTEIYVTARVAIDTKDKVYLAYPASNGDATLLRVSPSGTVERLIDLNPTGRGVSISAMAVDLWDNYYLSEGPRGQMPSVVRTPATGPPDNSGPLTPPSNSSIAVDPQGKVWGRIPCAVFGRLDPGVVVDGSCIGPDGKPAYQSDILSVLNPIFTPQGDLYFVETETGRIRHVSAPANAKFAQTITLAPLPSTLGVDSTPFTVTATANSGLIVQLSASPVVVCTISGNTVSLHGVGLCTITATQAGDSTYSAASPVSQTITVTPQSQTISFPAIPDRIGGAAFDLTATASSFLPVTFVSNSPGVCRASSGGALDPSQPGTCSITASQAGNATYAAATPVTRTFSISASPQKITFPNPGQQLLSRGFVNMTLSSDSGAHVDITATPSSVCARRTDNSVSLIASGTCSVTAFVSENGGFILPADPVTQSFAVLTSEGRAQSITFNALPDRVYGAAPFTISATATSGLPVTFTTYPASICTVNGNTVTILGSANCLIMADQSGSATYAVAPTVSQTFRVIQADQSITFLNPGRHLLSERGINIDATASSGLPVALTATPPAVCSMSSAKGVLFGAVGICQITASQPGDFNRTTATPVIQSFSITATAATQQSQAITFPAIPDHRSNDVPFNIQATASSGLPVTLSVASGPATINGATVSLSGTGTVTIQATQPGNANYNAAPVVTRSFNVSTTTTTPTGISITRVVNAASYAESQLAPATYAAVFGAGFLSGGSQATVTIRDVSGKQTAADQIYTGDAQINFLVPDDITLGAATLVVSNSSTTSAPFSFVINSTIPGLFSADSSGAGPAAAQAIVVFTASGSTATYTLGACDYSGTCVPASIPMNPGTEVYFVLYGTGIRGHLPNGVTATVGGTPVEVQYAGAQGGYPGLDQVNVRVPLSLAKSGVVNIQLTVDGKPANIVSVRLD